MSQHKPKVVCFTCKFGWGYLTDEAELAPTIENWIPIICSGKIDATHLLDAFKQGADGVVILGCPEGACHYQDGNFETRKKVHLLHGLLESYGIEKKRLRMILSTDPEGKTIPQLVKDMSQDIAELGPLKRVAVTRETARTAAGHRGGK